jgi:hypothetical protein
MKPQHQMKKEERENRDVLLLGYAKKLLLRLQEDQKKQTEENETYLAMLISLSKLSSPLSVELMVQESILTEGTIAFLLRLISSYLHSETNTSTKEEVFFYLSISINLLHYIVLSSAASNNKIKSHGCIVTNLVYRSTPSLLQVLKLHSSSSSEFHSAAIIHIDTQIIEIIHCILAYFYDYRKSNEDHFLDSSQILVPLLVRYRSLVTDQRSTSPPDQTLPIISQYRTHIISILHYILHNVPSSFLDTSSEALVKFLDLALTHDSTFYHFALQWCQHLFRKVIKTKKSGERNKEDPSSWSYLLRYNLEVRTLFSNLIVFGFQHYYNSSKNNLGNKIHEANEDDRRTTTTNTATDSGRLIISCDLFETIALAMEHMGGIWAIKHCVKDQDVLSIAAGSRNTTYNNNLDSGRSLSDSLLTLVIRMASGELRILLDLMLDKGRDDPCLNGKSEKYDASMVLLANMTLHCTRILFAVLKDLIEENDDECNSTIQENASYNWVHLLHFETILTIKEATEDAMHAMFQFVTATTPVSANIYSMMESDDLSLLDSVTVLCIKCLKLWLVENSNDNATIIPTFNEHEKTILCALFKETSIDAPVTTR